MESFIISKFGTDFTRSGDEMLYHCPYCPPLGKRNDDRKLYVNSKTGKFQCFRCETAGTVFGGDRRLASLLTDTGPSSAIDDLLEFVSPEVSEHSDIYYEIPDTRVVDCVGTVPYDYLISRGISRDMMDRYDIRAFGIGRAFHNRVIIPNRVVRRNWTDFYTGRAILNDMKPRYYNSRSSNKKNIVFNLHNIVNGQEIIVNEGSINSIIAGDNSVAILGKHASDEQIRQICMKNPPVLYISLDTDARKNALTLASKFHEQLPNCLIKLVDLPDGEDAASLGRLNYLGLLEDSQILYYPQSVSAISMIFDQFME